MSIYEVIGTYAQGIKSVTPFAALEYVPFIDQARLKEDLSDIFSVYNDSKGRREHMKLSGGLMRVVNNDVMDVMVRNFDRFEMWAHANNKEHINLERAFVHAPKELVRGLLAVHGRWELGAGRDAEAIHEIAQGRLTSAEDKEIRLIVESNPQAWVLYEATYPEDDLWDDLSDDTQDLIRALVPSGFSKIIEGAQNYGGGGADE